MKKCFLCTTTHTEFSMYNHVAWSHFEFYWINQPYLKAVRCWCGRLFYFKDALAEHLRRTGDVEKHYYDSALNAISKLDDS